MDFKTCKEMKIAYSFEDLSEILSEPADLVANFLENHYDTNEKLIKACQKYLSVCTNSYVISVDNLRDIDKLKSLIERENWFSLKVLQE